jgi:uncharacterized membrane protein YgcG
MAGCISPLQSGKFWESRRTEMVAGAELDTTEEVDPMERESCITEEDPISAERHAAAERGSRQRRRSSGEGDRRSVGWSYGGGGAPGRVRRRLQRGRPRWL